MVKFFLAPLPISGLEARLDSSRRESLPMHFTEDYTKTKLSGNVYEMRVVQQAKVSTPKSLITSAWQLGHTWWNGGTHSWKLYSSTVYIYPPTPNAQKTQANAIKLFKIPPNDAPPMSFSFRSLPHHTCGPSVINPGPRICLANTTTASPAQALKFFSHPFRQSFSTNLNRNVLYIYIFFFEKRNSL